MAERRRLPVYVVAICDGSGCRELLAMDDARHPRHAVRRLALMAATMRERDIIGVLMLLEAATGRVVARRRVWP
ncbi:MAG: hypothetical protein M3Q10_04715 [Chloroflexota bacterium]|nr:hypothetical protein [Chloroflexota bacterium]